MATQSQVKETVIGEHALEVLEFPEKASQTFKKGDLVSLDSAGRVQGVATGDILVIGIAREDASGTTDTMISVARITEDTQFSVCVTHDTPASAVTAIIDLVTVYGHTQSTRKGYVNKSDTTNDFWVPQEIAARDLLKGKEALGDQYGQLICKIKPACIQGSGVVS